VSTLIIICIERRISLFITSPKQEATFDDHTQHSWLVAVFVKMSKVIKYTYITQHRNSFRMVAIHLLIVRHFKEKSMIPTKTTDNNRNADFYGGSAVEYSQCNSVRERAISMHNILFFFSPWIEHLLVGCVGRNLQRDEQNHLAWR